MNEEIEYAEMLEIPVSTVNVVRKKRRKKQPDPTDELATAPNQASALKDSVIASVNDRLEQTDEGSAVEETPEGSFDFDPVPERIDTVRLYSTNGEQGALEGYDYPLNERGRYEANSLSPKKVRLALGIELGAACALCAGIFLTNVFLPGSAINTFFRALSAPAQETVTRSYTDFTLSPVVSELSDVELTLSKTGVLSFTDECHVYPTADGTVSEIVKDSKGLYTLKIEHSPSFSGVISGLDQVYYEVGDEVKANVPVGFTEGEKEVQVTMYADGELLNCFELTEENCLAWISTRE